MNLQIGFNARLFPTNWRPVIEEVHFGVAHGMSALQFPGKSTGLATADLGGDFKSVRQALDQADMVAVMEIMLRVDERGYTAEGYTPAEVVVANLPAIQALRCQCVHIHFVPADHLAPAQLPALEKLLLQSLDVATSLGREWGFRFGVEHNERSVGLFASPAVCAHTLEIIPQLAFVWDINHTHPDDLADFVRLLPRVSMLHISDTRLPETNEHLPLGQGNIDFVNACQTLAAAHFHGPAILEIGGLPKSGGYGRDTDAALVDSRQRLAAAWATATHSQ